MTDTDFDFDFDVGGGKPSKKADDGREDGNGRRPGSRFEPEGNGSAERDPFDALGDLDELGRDEFADEDRGNGADDGGILGLGRRFRPRRNGADRDEDSPAEGNGKPPLLYDDGGQVDSPPPPTPRPARAPRPAKPARETDPAREPQAPADDDWLSLADDNPAAGDLDSIAAPDDGPAGPRTPREGRNLAREARRRATGKSTSFEAVAPPPRQSRSERRLAAAAPARACRREGLRVNAGEPAAEERHRQARIGRRLWPAGACGPRPRASARRRRSHQRAARARPRTDGQDLDGRRGCTASAAAEANRFPPASEAEAGPGQEGSHRRHHRRPRRPGDGLHHLRDDGLALPRHPPAREQGAVRGGQELGGVRLRGPQDRHRALQHAADPGRVRGHLAVHQAGRGGDRGPALLRTPRGRLPGNRTRPVRGLDARRLHPGSLDDHPAVRQKRARGAGQQNDLPEVPRGRLRLPPRASVGQGQDPDPVPEHHLLRRGRLRDRGGRANLLRVPLSRLRPERRRPLLRGAGARGGGAAGGAHLLARGLLPARQSQRLRRPAQPRAAEDERAGRALRRGVR